jgi:hypothetical protein
MKMKTHANFDEYLADQSPKNRAIIRALRKFVKRVAPDLTESVKWGNGCWIGRKNPVAYVYSDTGFVQFGFFRGSTLTDRQGLLEGKGQYVRHIKVRTPSGIDEKAFAALLREAAGSKPAKAAASANKTKATGASVADYIASRADEEQRADCKALISLLGKITGQKPKMWGPSIVGFGSYRYTYDSGRSGEMCLAGFAIRGRDLVVYIFANDKKQKALLSKIGKHEIGKSCLYFRRLANLDRSVLEQLIVNSITEVKRRHGGGAA